MKIFELKKITLLKESTLLLGVLFLPIYQTINHWFFGVFIALSIIELVHIRISKSNIKIIGRYLLIGVFTFFLLRLITLIYSPDLEIGVKKIIQALPFLIYPLGILTLKYKARFQYEEFEKKLFWTLIIGCVITAVICWGNVILSMEPNPNPANRLFGWKKSGIYLTQILDIHPPYLGMLLCGSILFLLKEAISNSNYTKLKKVWALILSVFLFVFLFNITARNALFYLVFATLIYFIANKQWRFVISIFILMVISLGVIIKHPSQYYRLKMYHMLGLSDNKNHEDKRFKRLQASYNVFITNPVFGVGVGKDLELKVTEYEKMNDEIAAKKKLNSHNQFFEYLAAYGIIGGLSFVIAITIILYFLIRNKYYFLLILFLNVFFASFTESIFERVLGIQYYSILISIILLKRLTENEQSKRNEN